MCLSVLHENHLTHTDLKPENILFVNSDYDLVPGPKRPYAKKVLHVHCIIRSVLQTDCNANVLSLTESMSLSWLRVQWIWPSRC